MAEGGDFVVQAVLNDIFPDSEDELFLPDMGAAPDIGQGYSLEELQALYGGPGAPGGDALYPLWRDIQELIGPATQWPRKIREMFWTRNIKNWARVRVTAFAYINGLPVGMLLHWGVMAQMWRGDGDRKFRHVQRLYKAMEDGKQYRLWAWNVSQGRCEWLDGTPRIY